MNNIFTKGRVKMKINCFNSKFKKVMSFLFFLVLSISTVACSSPSSSFKETKRNLPKDINSIITSAKDKNTLIMLGKDKDGDIQVIKSEDKAESFENKKLSVDFSDKTILFGAIGTDGRYAILYGVTNKFGVTTTDTKELHIYDEGDKDIKIDIPVEDVDNVSNILFSSDSLIVVCSNGTIYQYNSETSELRNKINAEDNKVVISSSIVNDSLIIAYKNSIERYDFDSEVKHKKIEALKEFVDGDFTLISSIEGDDLYFVYDNSLYKYNLKGDKTSRIIKSEEETSFSKDNYIAVYFGMYSDNEAIGVFLDLDYNYHMIYFNRNK